MGRMFDLILDQTFLWKYFHYISKPVYSRVQSIWFDSGWDISGIWICHFQLQLQIGFKYMNLSLRGISNNTYSQFDFWHEIQISLTDASTDLTFVFWRLSSGPNLYNMSMRTPHLVTLHLSTVLLLLQRFIKTRGHKRIINSNSKLSQSMTLSRIQLSFHSYKYLLFQTQCLCIKWVVLLLDVFATF